MALSFGDVGRGYEVSATSPHRPGTIATADHRHGILVWPSAKNRPDWAAMAQALATAFVRGAEVHMYGSETE